MCGLASQSKVPREWNPKGGKGRLELAEGASEGASAAGPRTGVALAGIGYNTDLRYGLRENGKDQHKFNTQGPCPALRLRADCTNSLDNLPSRTILDTSRITWLPAAISQSKVGWEMDGSIHRTLIER